SGKAGCATQNLAPEWYLNHGAEQFANAIAVTDGADTPGIDATLDPGATVSGTVTDGNTGLPIANVSVRVFDVTGPEQGRACTDATGASTVSALDGGADGVMFVADGSCGAVASYPTQWYRDSDTAVGAAPVNVAPADQITGIDGHLRMNPTHTLTV